MTQNKTVLEKKQISPLQLKAIPFILSSDSIDAAAKESKIGRATINRWLKQPYFKSMIEEKRQELFEAGLSRLKAATDKASQVMIKLLDSKDETTQRLAAKDVLNFALKALETQDLEERIERIEAVSYTHLTLPTILLV